jgi:hypothetical protein
MTIHQRTMRRGRSSLLHPFKIIVLTIAPLMQPLSHASAYNQDTHALLADYAWQVLLTVDKISRNAAPQEQPFQSLTVSPEFAGRVQQAVRKIHTLPANLPKPKDSRCADPALIQELGTNSPNWQNGGDFFNMPLVTVRFPIAIDYETGNDCGIQLKWSPGPAYEQINKDDYTGTVLGYWAQYPDTLINDFHVGIKPTSVGGISALKEGLVAAGAIPAATVWIPVKCAWKCIKSIVAFSPSDCADCCKDAINQGATASHDVVSGLDSFVPIIGDIKSDFIVGMSHHINIPLNNADYDDISGLLTTRAGPLGVPGALELAATAVADVTGATVRFDDSAAPKNYDVANAQDGSADSRHRDAADWEFLPFPHIVMMPVDNLAWYGSDQYGVPPGRNTKFLGFVLHAIADASVPMHVVGAFGWGHRPYEDAVTVLHPSLLVGQRGSEPARLNTILLPRAEAYYRIIADWRIANPTRASEVPVRALVTAVAQQSWAIAQTDPAVFNDALSQIYLASSDAATLVYTGQNAIMRRLIDEAVAASIAFLTATGEVLP